MQEDLSLKLGQLFFVGFKGYTLSKETKKFLQTIQPGGIIFFERNIKDKKQVKKLINEINQCLKIKPFVAVDQEGGRVDRLKKIYTSIQSAYELSKLGLNKLLSSQITIINELLKLGFNTNFVPVLDVNSNSKNSVIGTRAMSNDPKIVSKYGSKIIELYLKHDVIPVAKHFPGHGDLSVDSHLELPVLSKSKSELNNFELIPFKNAIKNKVPMIMVGHIHMSKIEKEKNLPASLSKRILEGLLRKDLGFKGLILTDELNMKAVTKNYPQGIAAYKAISSGADMILFNWLEKSTLEAFWYIKGRIAGNKRILQRINESYKRILTEKKKLLTSS